MVGAHLDGLDHVTILGPRPTKKKKKKKNGNHLYLGNFFIKDMVFKKDLLIRSMQCELSVHPFKVEEKMTTS